MLLLVGLPAAARTTTPARSSTAGASAAATPPVRADLLAGSRAVRQDGWLLVHLQGAPYQIGYQRGYLTGKVAAQWVRSYLGPQGDRRTHM